MSEFTHAVKMSGIEIRAAITMHQEQALKSLEVSEEHKARAIELLKIIELRTEVMTGAGCR